MKGQSTTKKYKYNKKDIIDNEEYLLIQQIYLVYAIFFEYLNKILRKNEWLLLRNWKTMRDNDFLAALRFELISLSVRFTEQYVRNEESKTAG